MDKSVKRRPDEFSNIAVPFRNLAKTQIDMMHKNIATVPDVCPNKNKAAVLLDASIIPDLLCRKCYLQIRNLQRLL